MTEVERCPRDMENPTQDDMIPSVCGFLHLCVIAPIGHFALLLTFVLHFGARASEPLTPLIARGSFGQSERQSA